MAARISLSRPQFDAQELEAVRRVLESGWLVQGPEVEAFEAEIARLHEARHCVAVSSGTAALHVSYLASGLNPGEAVFIPGFAWPSAANMAKLIGAQPVFVDVLPDSYNIDPSDLETRLRRCLAEGKNKPRLIVPVHEFGLAAPMDKIASVARGSALEVIEDAACALGARINGKPVGTQGSFGVFSFHPRKSITTGEGGAIITNDASLAERCRAWRNHGQQVRDGNRTFVLPGLNYRMTEMQAAIGRVQLAKFAGILEKRRALASRYLTMLKGNHWLRPPASIPEHTWQTLMVVLGENIDRAQLIAALGRDGIEVGPGSVAAHVGEHFQPQTALPVSEQLHQRGLALPLHAGISEAQVDFVVERLCGYLERCSNVRSSAHDAKLVSGQP